jgi:hypothetical protein
LDQVAKWKEGRAMNHAWRVNQRLIGFSIALVWFYQGLWCKVLAGGPRHLSVISAVPFIGPNAGRAALVLLGLLECGLGLWVLTGRRRREAAVAQTLLLVLMNTGGLIWAWHLIPDPAGMILQNFAFVLLIWAAAEVHPNVASA